MGLIKKWQIEKSNTLELANNIAEVKDGSITKDKIQSSIDLIKKEKRFISVVNSASSIPIYYQLNASDSSLSDNAVGVTVTPSTATTQLIMI